MVTTFLWRWPTSVTQCTRGVPFSSTFRVMDSVPLLVGILSELTWILFVLSRGFSFTRLTCFFRWSTKQARRSRLLVRCSGAHSPLSGLSSALVKRYSASVHPCVGPSLRRVRAVNVWASSSRPSTLLGTEYVVPSPSFQW